MDKKLEICGVTLAYSVAGEGLPVLLMHGWGCTRQTVASIENLLTPHFRVVNIDFPGCGQSSEPPTVWGVDDYDRMLEGLVDAEGLDRPILIGHSHGGRVAIQYASHHPVRKLVLIDAAGVKPRRNLRYYAKVYSFKAFKRLALLTLGRQRGECFIEKYRRRAGSADYAQSSPRMRAIMSRLVNTDLRPVMPQINCPTLMIWGENDTATPLAHARQMERLIPDAGIASFAGAGHFSFLDRPAQFAAVLRNFLTPDMNTSPKSEPNG